MGEGNKEKFVRVRPLQSLFEGQQAEAMLKEAGIDCMVVSYGDTALDGLFQTAKGWGEIRCAESRKADAERILIDALPASAPLTEEDLATEALRAPVPQDEPPLPPISIWIWILRGVAAVLAAALVLVVYEVLK